jgi:hypothetical protein
VDEFYTGEREFKFSIYRVPFNDGKGGKAEPVKGASHNNKSNFFPKISPNGKWMVYTQAENFMLLQPDSKLYIVPAARPAGKRWKIQNLRIRYSYFSKDRLTK